MVIQTSEFGKRRYVAMKVSNQGKALCGNTNVQTVLSMETFTVGQYKVLSTAKGSACQYNCLKKGKLLCDRTKCECGTTYCVSVLLKKRQGFMWQCKYLNAGNGTVLCASN